MLSCLKDIITAFITLLLLGFLYHKFGVVAFDVIFLILLYGFIINEVMKIQTKNKK